MVAETECAESTSVEAGRKSLEFSLDENKRQSHATDQLSPKNRMFLFKVYFLIFPTTCSVYFDERCLDNLFWAYFAKC